MKHPILWQAIKSEHWKWSHKVCWIQKWIHQTIKIYQKQFHLTLVSVLNESSAFRGNNKVWSNRILCHCKLIINIQVCILFCAWLIPVFKSSSTFKSLKSAVWTILSYKIFRCYFSSTKDVSCPSFNRHPSDQSTSKQRLKESFPGCPVYLISSKSDY